MSIIFTLATLACFCRSQWSGRLPLAWSLFGLRVVPIAPTFVTRDDLRKKVWVTFNLIFQLLAQSQTSVFLVLCEQAGNKLHGNASHVQIHGQNPLTGNPTHTCSVWDLVSCVLTILIDFFSNFFDILRGRTCWRAPRMKMTFNARFSSFELRKPLENLCTAQCFLLKGILKHLICFCDRFSETETKSQADSLFGTVIHRDFARGAWQHLGELTTQACTTFYGDIRRAADSWRVQLHLPSGGTLNYDLEELPEASPVFFGSPHVCSKMPCCWLVIIVIVTFIWIPSFLFYNPFPHLSPSQCWEVLWYSKFAICVN